MELTEKQQEVLRFIQNYLAKQGIAPSVREIGDPATHRKFASQRLSAAPAVEIES